MSTPQIQMKKISRIEQGVDQTFHECCKLMNILSSTFGIYFGVDQILGCVNLTLYALINPLR